MPEFYKKRNIYNNNKIENGQEATLISTYFTKLKLNKILTEIKIFNKFSRVGNCGINFCTTLLNASKML